MTVERCARIRAPYPTSAAARVAGTGRLRMLRQGRLSAAYLAAVLLGFAADGAGITEYPIPTASSYPYGIVAGPDGALWFTEVSSIPGTGKIGRITTGGVITEFTVPTANSAPFEICVGPDGALWFTENNKDKIGRITTDGTITEFSIPTSGSYPQGITTGPDGNLWFTEYGASKIGRMTPAGVFAEFIIPTAGSYPHRIVSGPDGNLWFTEGAGNRIGRITTTGFITEYFVASPSNPTGICVGADGALWFTEWSANKIGRITTEGVITEFPLSGTNSAPNDIVAGLDGNLWFAENNTDKIGRITTAGVVTEFTVPTALSVPMGICTGPDGALWFTEWSSVGNNIGRLSLPGTYYYTLTPCRVLDTRLAVGPLGGPPLAGFELRRFPFAGSCGIPADAVAVAANVSVVNATTAGALRVYRGDISTPNTTYLPISPGKIRSNNGIVALGADAQQLVAIQQDGSGSVDVIFDVSGYFK